MSRKNLRTGEVATQAGVSIATLRYYERRGLIPPPSRTSSGYRAFEPETVRTVRLIKRAQALGFTLKEIHHLLSICLSHGTCADLHEAARAKVDDLDHQIRSLSGKREALGELLTDCPRDTAAPATDCPILEQLEQFEPSNDEVVGDDSAG
jgi:MerR family mercuric resistance operon transcriptional regulator